MIYISNFVNFSSRKITHHYNSSYMYCLRNLHEHNVIDNTINRQFSLN